MTENTPTELIMTDPYDEGYQQGYEDNLPECPYPEGTQEAKAWNEGYADGSRDN